MIAYLTFVKHMSTNQVFGNFNISGNIKNVQTDITLVGLVYLPSVGIAFAQPTPDPGLVRPVKFTSPKFEVCEIPQSI